MSNLNFKELRGEKAKKFADENLKKVEVDPKNWIIKYRDPETGCLFVMDFVHPERHGGGVPRLRPMAGEEKNE